MALNSVMGVVRIIVLFDGQGIQHMRGVVPTMVERNWMVRK